MLGGITGAVKTIFHAIFFHKKVKMSRKTNYAFTGGFYSGAIRGGNIADIISCLEG